MKKLLAALLLALLPGMAIGQDGLEPGELGDASSVTATDDFVCDQGAEVLACTALQIATYIKTHFDTEAELEAIVADVTNIIIEAEIDTEAELEAIVGDVTDIYTNNDADFVTEAEIADGAIEESHLDASNSPTDGYVLTYSTDPGSDFEWEVSGVGTGDVTSVGDCLTLNCFDGEDESGGSNDLTFESAGAGDILLTAGTASTDYTVTLPSEDGTLVSSATTLAGDIAGTTGATTIEAEAVTEADLDIENAPQDEYYLTYEVDTGNLEWEVSSASGATSQAELESDLADVADVLTDIDTSITFTGAIDLITSSDGDIDLSPNGTGEVNLNAPVNTDASSDPVLVFKDDDAGPGGGGDGDDNAIIAADCTTCTTGAEDVDVFIKQQVAGALVTRGTFDADGTVLFDDLEIEGSTDCSGVSIDGVPCWENDAKVLWIGDGSAPPTEVGTGTGAFSDAGDPIVQNDTTKEVQMGDGAGTLDGKVEIGGDADEPQLVIEGYSSQTDSIFIIQQDDDDEVFSVDNDGTTTIAGSTSTITGSGTYVEIDDVLYITPAATPPIACTTNSGIIYHDTSGVICICDGASSWVEVVDYSGTGACS